MNLDDLLSKCNVEKFESADDVQIGNEIEIAISDVSSAKKMLTIGEWGWAHNAAYNAMLQSGRALMLAKGYRPKAYGHHYGCNVYTHCLFITDPTRCFKGV